MKVQVLQENFSKALSLASRFTSIRTQLPVLGNVLISTKKNKLLVASTNLEISIACTIGAKIEEEGEITVPSKVITDIVLNLAKGPVDLETEKEQLTINASGFSSNVLGMNSSDFPSIPQELSTNKISIPKENLLSAIGKVVFSASVDESRPVLTGVLFIFEKEGLTLVATDGFRLSRKKLSTNNKSFEKNFILPKTSLVELSKISEGEELLNLEFKEKENQVMFGTGDAVLASRVIEGEFPEFEKIIPKTSSVWVSLDKEELIRAVKLASVFAKESANIVKILLQKEKIEVFAESSQSGSQKTLVEAKVEGVFSESEQEIAFNFRFLEEYLHVVSGDDLKIGLTSPFAPGVFLDPKDNSYLHLIMPVRIQQ